MKAKTIYKNEIAKFIKKTLAVILVGVFLSTNTYGWAKEEKLSLAGMGNNASSNPADNNKLAPPYRLNSDKFKYSLTVAAICKHVERDGNLDDKSYLNDVLARLDAEKYSNMTVLPDEIIIEIPSEGLVVRYFDPTKANVITPYSDISKLSTTVIGPRLNRQVIHRIKTLPFIFTAQTKSLSRNFGKTGLRFFALGIGSIWFGRQWPPNNASYTYPDFEEVKNYLDKVFQSIGDKNGIIMVDTAAAYGLSEEIVGRYFGERESLMPKVFIATKWGEEYDIQSGLSTIDHSVECLVTSVKRSLGRLGKIDLLYIHGTTVEVLRNMEIMKKMTQMKEEHFGGIQYIGASISNEAVLETAVNENLIEPLDVIQIPVSIFLKRFDLISKIHEKGIAIVINSPIRKGDNRKPQDIYTDLLNHRELSIILTGSRHHFGETLGYVISAAEDKVESTIEKQNDYTNESKALFRGVLGENKPDTLVRVPIEAIESIDIDNIKNLLATFQKAPNGYIELYYMSGIGEVSEGVYQKYGLQKKVLPKDFKRTRENTVTLFPALKGEEINQSIIVSRLGGLNIIPENTILSPVGLQHDLAGLIRATILGLKIMDIARQVKEGKLIDKDAVHVDILNQLRDVLDSSDFKNFDLTSDDIMALATGNINSILSALRKLIKLLPIAPINAEELRQIYEHAKQTLIAA